MPIFVFVGAVAVAASIPILWWSISSAQPVNRSAAVENLVGGHRGVADLREVVLTRSARERAVAPFMHSLGERLRRLTPVGMIETLDHRLALAGRPAAWPLDRVLAAKLVGGLFGTAFGAWYFLSDPSLKRLLFSSAIAAIAFFAADLQLYSKGKERQKSIEQALPDVLDQMTICVEAGLGFEAAMVRAGRSGKGPMADELVRTLQEMQVGVGRGEALRNLALRSEAPDLRHFTSAIVQAEAYGIPVADVLRTQAAELRLKRRQRAEERAMKIPVKIVIPLVLCILPSLFIIILGPAAINIYNNIVAR